MLGPVRFVPQRWITVMDCLYLSTNWESKPVSSTYHKLWFWKYGNVLKIRNRFRWAQILSEDVGGEGRVAGGSMGHISWARTLSKSRRRRVIWRDRGTNCEQEFCKKKVIWRVRDTCCEQEFCQQKSVMEGLGHMLWACKKRKKKPLASWKDQLTVGWSEAAGNFT